MSEHTDAVTWELLTATRGLGRIDRARARQLLAEAWTLGWMARADPDAAEVNPFLAGRVSRRAPNGPIQANADQF